MEQVDLKGLRDILDKLIKDGYDSSDIKINVEVTANEKDEKDENKKDILNHFSEAFSKDGKGNFYYMEWPKIDFSKMLKYLQGITSDDKEEVTSIADTIKHPLAKQVYLKLEKDLPYLVNPNYGFKVEYNEDGTTVFNMGVVKLIFHNNNNDMIYFNIAFPNEFKVPLNALFDNVLDSSIEVPMNLIADFVKSGVMYADKLFTPFSMYYISDVMLGTKKNMKVMDLSYIKYIQKVSMFLKDKNQFREITNKVAKIIGSLKEIITSKEALSEHMLETLDILPDEENKKTIFSYVIYTE